MYWFLLLVSSFVSAYGDIESKSLTYTLKRTYLTSDQTAKTASIGLLVLHGGSSEESVKTKLMPKLSETLVGFPKDYPVAVFYPLGVKGSCPYSKENLCWPLSHPSSDVEFLTDVIRKESKKRGIKYWIDIGVSNGGYYLASLIQSGEQLPVDSVILILGGKSWRAKQNLKWTPDLWILAAKKDKSNRKNAKRLFRELNRAQYSEKAKLAYHEYDGGHKINWPILRNTLKEIFARKIIKEDEINYYQCESDKECVSVKNGCCGCTSGGQTTAINEFYYNHWHSEFSEKCKETACLAVISNHWTCFAQPRCIKGKCVLKK